MEELSKKDSEVLDQILSQVKWSEFLQLDTVIDFKECSYYFGIISRYPSIFKVSTAKPQMYLITVSTNTEEFKRSGGFVGVYNRNQEEIRKNEEREKILQERENLVHSNNVYINKELRFKDKFRIPLFMMSIIGQISGVIFGTIKLFSNNNGENNNSTPLTISLILMIIGVIAGVIFGWIYLLSNNNGETNN